MPYALHADCVSVIRIMGEPVFLAKSVSKFVLGLRSHPFLLVDLLGRILHYSGSQL